MKVQSKTVIVVIQTLFSFILNLIPLLKKPKKELEDCGCPAGTHKPEEHPNPPVEEPKP